GRSRAPRAVPPSPRRTRPGSSRSTRSSARSSATRSKSSRSRQLSRERRRSCSWPASACRSAGSAGSSDFGKEKHQVDIENPRDRSAAREEAGAALDEALHEIKRVIVGQDAMLERLLIALMAGGHVLLEGVPGLAKT